MSLKENLKNNTLLSAIGSFYRNYLSVTRKKFGYIHPTAFYRQPILIKGVENVYMEEGSHILGHSVIITTRAKFILKKHSGAAEGLTVVTGNHEFTVGEWGMNVPDSIKSDEYDKDVVVEEDVLMMSNVTLLSGVRVGRGSLVGSGAVVRNNVPPYAIVLGNPARIVGFKFTPEEIVEHEKALYSEYERIPLEKLEKNYEKYFLKRIALIPQLSA